MKTSPLLNVPLLRLVRVPVTPVRHYRSITYAPNLFVLCINIEADELVSAFLLPSWVTGTFLPLSFGTGKSMNAGISGWLMREKEANPFVGCQRVFFWATFWGWIIKRQHQIKPVASWVSQTEEEEKNKTEKMWDSFLNVMIEESFDSVNIVNVLRSHPSLRHRLLLFWNHIEVLPSRSSVSAILTTRTRQQLSEGCSCRKAPFVLLWCVLCSYVLM